jgi:8-oxo-dGTP pyrophosphatase MutT (NUDIX family)
VFPGGAVDAADALDARDLDVDVFRVAAARECMEEAGIRVNPRDLLMVARWVTPEGAPRRFDTRFFIARAPEGQHGLHDGTELVSSAWVRPADALRSHQRGEIDLILPTQRSLELLARYDAVDALFADLRDAPCPT